MFNTVKHVFCIRNLNKFKFSNILPPVQDEFRRTFSYKCKFHNIILSRYIWYGLAFGTGVASSVKVAHYVMNKINCVNAYSDPEKKTSPRSQYNFLTDVVQKTSEAVVNIQIVAKRPFSGSYIFVSKGSGFIVKSDGLILTNAHVVNCNGEIMVKLHNGQCYLANIENIDSQSDLATLRIQAKNLPILPLGDSSSVLPGEFVIAVGSPYSLNHTITAGVVSSPSRQGNELGLHSKNDYVQTDAAINIGNSGGPLVNLDGEAIGINCLKVSEGISLAIPSNRAKEFLKEIEIENTSKKDLAKKKHKFLGMTVVTLSSVTLNILKEQNPDFSSLEHGVLVWRVIVGSPSYEYGIRPGDVISEINDKEVKCASDVQSFIEFQDKLSILVVRGKKVFKVQIPVLDFEIP